MTSRDDARRSILRREVAQSPHDTDLEFVPGQFNRIGRVVAMKLLFALTRHYLDACGAPDLILGA